MTPGAATPPAPRTAIHAQVESARSGNNPNLVARLPSGWAVLADSQLLEGYCLLLPDPVVDSLNDLDETARTAFLLDMTRLGDAVTAVRNPRRINYEILGNLEPALHAHIIPRYAHEPEALRTKPVWSYPPDTWNSPAHAFHPERHALLKRQLADALTAPSPPPRPPPYSASSAYGPAEPPLWQPAAHFAARLHEGQTRKDGSTPYIAHPFRVTMTVRDLFGETDPVCLAAAVLHDTIEDTTADYDEIEEHFGADVARCVAALTKDMRLPEAEREPAYDEQLRRADPRARLIKLADTYDNLSDMAASNGRVKLDKMLDKCRRAIALAEPDAGNSPVSARAIALLRDLMRRAESPTGPAPNVG